MSDKITFSYKNALPFISDNEILMQKEMIGAAHDMIHKKGREVISRLASPSAAV